MENYIKQLLKKYNILDDRLVDKESMKLWKKAFTHETYDPNNNYEELETLGDSIIKPIFIDYVMRSYDNLTSSQITNMVIYYLSGDFMVNLANKLGLSKYILCKIDISNSIIEDVFESFIGCLYKLGNEKLKDGIGYLLCTIVLYYIFNDENIDKDIIANPRIEINSLFGSILWDNVVESITPLQEKQIRYILKFPHNAMEVLKQLNITNEVIVDKIGINKRKLKYDVYNEALRKLDELGLNKEWFEQNRKLILSKIDGYNEALQKSKKEGYVDIYFKQIKSTSEDKNNRKLYNVMLVGVKQDGKLANLGIGTDYTINASRIKALNNYIGKL